MTIGVYQIVCVPTGKRYIGSSCDIKERWRKHRAGLNRDKHDNIHLQRAWNKYGKRVFQFEILEECESGQEKIREQHYLDSLQPEFNLTFSACGFSKGHEMSAETRAKISATKQGENNPNYGKTLSDETKAILSAANKGENNPNYGKTFTDETKEKMRAGWTPERRAAHAEIARRVNAKRRAKKQAEQREHEASLG